MPLRCTDDEFRALALKHTTRTGILRELGHPTNQGAFNRYVNEKAKALGLDTSHWMGSKGNRVGPKISLTELCVSGRAVSSVTLKKRLFREGILENRCSKCGLGPKWQGEPLSLHLDHIDGCHTNNQLSNLRILCPNCHTQTPTYGCKRTRVIRKCACGAVMHRHSGQCSKCSNASKPSTPKIEWPSVSELTARIEKSSRVQVAKELGVSDTAVKKHIRKHQR